MSDASRKALASRLGVQDYRLTSNLSDPIPLVTLEEYFNDNDPTDLELHFHGLHLIRDREDVADLRLGITVWDGPNSWPSVEYVYVVTSARVRDAKLWFSEIGLIFDELKCSGEHRKREPLDVPKGFKVVWGWWD